jgi:hypothetical protein
MSERVVMEATKRILVEEAQRDTVGLWAVLWQVKKDMPSLGQDDARRVAIALIGETLGDNQIVPGEFVDRDEETEAFVPWLLSADEAVERIESEWGRLGREPSIGDIVWFVGPGLLPLVVSKHPMGEDWKVR